MEKNARTSVMCWKCEMALHVHLAQVAPSSSRALCTLVFSPVFSNREKVLEEGICVVMFIYREIGYI